MNNNKEKENPLKVQIGGKHYKKGGMQPIELIEGVRMYSSCSSILRYIYRHKDKNGKQDLVKVLHYCDFVEKYGNWYQGCYVEPKGVNIITGSIGLCFDSIDNTKDIFYRFIKSNPHLDSNQIQVILAIQNKDLQSIRFYTQKEIEENYD